GRGRERGEGGGRGDPALGPLGRRGGRSGAEAGAGGGGSMKTIRRWPCLALSGLGLALTLTTGCQTWVPGVGMTLPSGRYLQHPPQYIPPSPPFPLSRELAYQERVSAQAGGLTAAPTAGPPAPVVPPGRVPPGPPPPLPGPRGAPPRRPRPRRPRCPDCKRNRHAAALPRGRISPASPGQGGRARAPGHLAFRRNRPPSPGFP